IRDDLVTGVQTCALPICLHCLDACLRARFESTARQIQVSFCLPFLGNCVSVPRAVATGLLSVRSKSPLILFRTNGLRSSLSILRSEERRVGKDGIFRWCT